MPEKEIPEEFKPISSPSNSSLSSTASSVDVILISANFMRNSRSASISSSTSTNVRDDESSIESSVNNLYLANSRNRSNNNEIEEVDEEEESFQPIKLPTEPTLEELLKQVTGRSDLSTVEQLKLRIVSSTISLQRLPYFMPRLRCLSLENSMLFSLRDLGCDLSSLTYLNISRCGLKSLDGTNGLSTLNELIADHNLIEDAGACSNIPQIRKISLINNQIKDFHGMMFLGLCSHLRVLDMSNNAITLKENYRQIVRIHIPTLAILDQIPYEDVSDAVKCELSRSDYHTIPITNSSNILHHLNNITTRPSTASPMKEIPVTHITIGQRPSTADKVKQSIKCHNLSVGEPVCGNIIAKARKARKLKTAWGESVSSSSSSSFCSSDSSNQTTPLNSARNLSSNDNDTCEKLLENARLWREKSREARERFNDV